MSSQFIIKPYDIATNAVGLCNQLMYFINGVLFCYKNGIPKLLITNFITDNSTLVLKPISEIIDFNETNKFLKKYNVSISDLVNPSNNVHIHNTSLDENYVDASKFFDIFNNIKFNDKYYNLSNNLINEIKFKLGDDVKINIIHLRVEKDAIIHWSRINNMNPILFNILLEQKYINLINKYINKHVFTVVMTYSMNNNVIKFLKKNGYNFFISKKDVTIGRECNALTDLLLARQIDNFFIGVGGSTFTHLINNSTPNKKKTIMFDINNIKKPIIVVNY